MQIAIVIVRPDEMKNIASDIAYSTMRCSFSHLFWYFVHHFSSELYVRFCSLLYCRAFWGFFFAVFFLRLFAVEQCLSLAIYLRSSCWCNWDWGLKCFSHSIQDCIPPQMCQPHPLLATWCFALNTFHQNYEIIRF